jgi:Lipocalin-like domain
MNRHRRQFWSLGLLALAWLCLGAGTAAAEKAADAGPPRNPGSGKLVGTWKLVSIDERRASGERVVPLDYGPEPLGLIMYDAAGYMSAQAVRRGRPKLDSDDIHRATPEQAKTAFVGYNAYFGTYEVREREGVVIHHVVGGLNPNWEGGQQFRRFQISGDTLVLEPPEFTANGEKRTRRLTWQRVR